MRLCTLLLIILSLQSLPGAKAMFYDPGDRGFSAAIQPREKLRPVETRGPCLHCGIHYWLETEKGEPVNGRGDTPNTHDMLTGSQPDGTAFSGNEDRTCGNYTKGGAEGGRHGGPSRPFGAQR